MVKATLFLRADFVVRPNHGGLLLSCRRAARHTRAWPGAMTKPIHWSAGTGKAAGHVKICNDNGGLLNDAPIGLCISLASIEDWRGDARYPAMIVKTINQHLEGFVFNSSFAGEAWDILGQSHVLLPLNSDTPLPSLSLPPALLSIPPSPPPFSQHTLCLQVCRTTCCPMTMVFCHIPTTTKVLSNR